MRLTASAAIGAFLIAVLRLLIRRSALLTNNYQALIVAAARHPLWRIAPSEAWLTHCAGAFDQYIVIIVIIVMEGLT